MSDVRTGPSPYKSPKPMGAGDDRTKLYLGVGAAVVVVILVVLAIVLTGGSGGGSADEGSGAHAAANAEREQAPITVTGDPLASYPDSDTVLANPAMDPAVGQTPPKLEGVSFDSSPMVIDPADGRAKVIIFLAHWCPHCQNEVPVVQDWVDAGNLPDGVKLVAVSTLTDRRRPNWPPQNWLVRESWSSPVIMDNNINAVSAAFGMAGTPFWVALDGNNRVLARVAGEIGVDGIAQLAGLAAASLVD